MRNPTVLCQGTKYSFQIICLYYLILITHSLKTFFRAEYPA